MTLNIGHTDRTLRFTAAAAFLALALFATDGVLSLILGLAAIVLAVTASVGTCPAYLPFGFSTRRT